MVIDFHTHIFPEKIAARAVRKLSEISHLVPDTNGCASGLLSTMEHAGIDVSVVLPVVTNPDQFDSILRFAALLNETYASFATGRLISFAGIHPMDPDYREKLTLIKREGFPGIKIHPNYQGLDFTDIRFKRLLYAASELDLPVLTHTGYDPYTPDREYCTADMIAEVVREVAPRNLILAHMGDNLFFDDAEEKVCGLEVYMDTSYALETISEEQFVRMVRKHGADKVLFASDSPWAHQDRCVEILQNCSLSAEEKEMIFSGNAKKLLKDQFR